jgi:ATP-dependent helicase/nuclease subunit A
MALATKIIEKQQGYAGELFDPAASVFVSANAGSGKTSQLTRRVLGLLLSGVQPGKILCLTFTNAAAAEMKQRVQAELGAWVMAEEKTLHDTLTSLLGRAPDTSMLARARSLFAEVLEAPEGVRIQTIHGFCQSLLARFPIEAGISPYFSVMDSRTADEMLAAARLDLLVSRAHSLAVEDAIRTLAQTLNTEDFQSLLGDIVKNKFKFQSLLRLPGGIEAAIEELRNELSVTSDTTLTSLIETHFTYDTATENKLRTIADILLKTNDQKLGQTLADWLFAVDSRAEMLEHYLLCFLTQKNTKRKSLCTKGNLSHEALSDLIAEQERVAEFHNTRQSLQIALQSSCVLHLAEALLVGYENLKRMHAKMDYDDLILTARDLLQQPGISPWVLYKLDGGIDHVLVDEAQDTSPQQWEIVKALTEDFFSGLSRSDADRSLFIVGDEKQSIFSFQGADVRQLAEVHAWFSARIIQAKKMFKMQLLEHSYRSLPTVLQAVDAVFASPKTRMGVVAGNTALIHVPQRIDQTGLVEIWPVIMPIEKVGGTGRGYISPQSQLARKLAETIRNWIDEGKWQAGDIMILVRTRTAFVDQMVRELKRKDVPVAGVDRMRLSKNLAVMDLTALGKIMLLPEDDLTLAAVLKSPIGNISEEKLFELAWNRGEKSLWQQLEREDIYALLADLRAKADYLLPYEFYTYALDTLGLRKKMLGRMGVEYADPIEEFLSQTLAYQQENAPSLQGFLHWLEASDSEIKRDMEQAHNTVRIMTVHGAKGLQAPVVILADTVKMPVLRDKPLWNDILPIWVKATEDDNTLSAELRAAAKEAMLEEYRRLLYVAMTRAEDALYICGASSKKPGEQCWYTLVQQALTPLSSPCDTPAGEGIKLGSHTERSEVSLRKIQRKAPSSLGQDDKQFAFLTTPPPSESLPSKPLTPSHVGEEPSAASPLKQNVYQRGLFIHSLLQHLPSLPEEIRRTVAKSLALPYRVQMQDTEIENCINEAEKVMAQFPEVFSADSLAEAPIVGTIEVKGEPFVVSGQIDRLAILEKEIWIVDYKTNRQPPENAGNTPMAYLRQMAVYRALLREIYPHKRVQSALLWTAGPRMDVLDEAVLGSYI